MKREAHCHQNGWIFRDSPKRGNFQSNKFYCSFSSILLSWKITNVNLILLTIFLNWGRSRAVWRISENLSVLVDASQFFSGGFLILFDGVFRTCSRALCAPLVPSPGLPVVKSWLIHKYFSNFPSATLTLSKTNKQKTNKK